MEWFRETCVSRHNGDPIKGSLKPLNTIVLRWSEGFERAFHWAPMMPICRTDTYVCCFFQSGRVQNPCTFLKLFLFNIYGNEIFCIHLNRVCPVINVHFLGFCTEYHVNSFGFSHFYGFFRFTGLKVLVAFYLEFWWVMISYLNSNGEDCISTIFCTIQSCTKDDALKKGILCGFEIGRSQLDK